jgi:hypothetical protein
MHVMNFLCLRRKCSYMGTYKKGNMYVNHTGEFWRYVSVTSLVGKLLNQDILD